MNSYDQQIFNIWEKYLKARPKIQADPDLSPTGKRSAVEALATDTLKQFESLRREVRAESERLQLEVDSLEAQAQQGAALNEEEIAQERRQADLVISQAVAARDAGALMRAAEEAATQAPGAFLLAYPELMKTADQLLPKVKSKTYDPWAGDQEPAKETGKERARLLAELARHYNQAAAQVKTPDQVKAAEKAEAVREERNNIHSAAALIKRFEKQIAGPGETWAESTAKIE